MSKEDSKKRFFLLRWGFWKGLFKLCIFIAVVYGARHFFPVVAPADMSNFVDKGEHSRLQKQLRKIKESTVSSEEYKKVQQENIILKQAQKGMVSKKNIAALHASYKNQLLEQKAAWKKVMNQLSESKDGNMALQARIDSLMAHIKKQQAAIKKLRSEK